MARRVDNHRGMVGVILRDSTGMFYAISAERLASLQVSEEQQAAVEALIRGDDLIGFAGGVDGTEEFAALLRSLQEIAGERVRSFHLTHVAASLWVIAADEQRANPSPDLLLNCDGEPRCW